MNTLQAEAFQAQLAPQAPLEVLGTDPEAEMRARFNEIVAGIDDAVPPETREGLKEQRAAKESGGTDFGNLMFG